ncbi:MAG: lipopolysaccharide biosynthesis protein [Muribaculaceae bacterium]|nr:lipopolysaccharide biosynthesis protein [Muribaculaceae bacterium]
MSDLKLKTARSIKWNTIDRVSTQLLYAVVGIVLANLLSEKDFGLVGLLLGFQAFANLFVDSGFGTALLQKKDPTETDYSTVFWFNLVVSLVIYAILFFCAPLIADTFHGEKILIPLSRVLFLTFVINALSIVQTNRLMKRMDVKMLAVANTLGLFVSGIVGVWMAIAGYGVWALVWQYVVLGAVKTAWLWVTCKWWPRGGFSLDSLKQIYKVGLSVFSSSMLNTICLQIYTFVIGALNFTLLGIYTQADKWSKMSSASVSQILTATFVPLLSNVQDDPVTFHRYMKRVNRFTAFLLFPVMFGLAAVGAPLFHTLFGHKWDAAIPIFQILTIRGIFIVMISLYNNFILSIGASRKLFAVELVKDALIFVAILSTMWTGNLTLIVWGQFAASAITYFIVLRMASQATGYPPLSMLSDLFPSLGVATAMGIISLLCLSIPLLPPLRLITMIAAGAASYVILSRIFNLPELKDASSYLLGRFRKKSN